MIYEGHHLVYVIDDADGAEACYRYAGIVGVSARKHTLRQLWMMAEGVLRQRRIDHVQLACIALSHGVDVERYLETGVIGESSVGKPLELTPEMQARVDAEVERIRRENPHLPSLPVVK
jgi:hypothetical protein